MSILTEAFYNMLAGDAILVDMLATYKGNPGVFTIDPVPGDARLPYVVTAGEAVQLPFDCKVTRGREAVRDVRAYAAANGDTTLIEAIAERVRYVFHRRPLTIGDHQWVLSNVVGPIAVDEPDYYGRVVSVSVKAQEE